MTSDLMSAPVVVVAQVPKFSSPREEYDLFGPDGTQLGRIEEQPSLGSFFARKLSTLTFAVTDNTGATIATIEKPGAIGRSTFYVSDAAGQQVGSISQDNAFLDPQFTLTTEAGELHLTSAAINAWGWTLADSSGAAVGQITRQFAGLADVLTRAKHFVVELGPTLAGSTRLTALVACACLDVVQDIRARR